MAKVKQAGGKMRRESCILVKSYKDPESEKTSCPGWPYISYLARTSGKPNNFSEPQFEHF